MLIIPDAKTMFLDPFIAEPTLSLICDVFEPATKEKYSRCPRNIAQKAADHLINTGIADTAFFGPEAFIQLIHLKEDGTAEKKKDQILVISPVIKKDIFRFPLLIN